MSHCMDNITKIRICHSLWRNGISPEEIPDQLNIHRATVYRWIKKFKQGGLKHFIKQYKLAKKGRKQPRKTHPITKIRICEIRKKYKNCCGEKIRYILKRDDEIKISLSTIYRVLHEYFTLRSKWKKKSKRGPVKKGTKPRDVIQTDTVDFGDLYAFTMIDTFTREVSVIIKDSQTSQAGKEALQSQLYEFGKIHHIQRDGGSEFKAEWEDYAKQHIPSIRTARPYKKNEQAFIERFNGILRKECLGYPKYKKKDIDWVQKKVDNYIEYYHNQRPHLSLNMLTPKQFAMSHLT